MTTGEIVSIVITAALAFVSIALAGVAIWLSWKFSREASQSSKDIEGATNDIKHSVAKLEQIFNTLYSDTFSMMKSTVTKMTEHAWPETAVGGKIKIKKETEKMSELKEEKDKDILHLLERQNLTEDKIKKLGTEFSHLLENTISDVGKIRNETKSIKMRNKIVSVLANSYYNRPEISAKELWAIVSPPSLVPFFKELKKLRNEKLITWKKTSEDKDDDIQPNTIIRMNPGILDVELLDT